jgi:hypothetical protein
MRIIRIMIKLLELIDKLVLKYLNFRNLVFVQRTHCNDPGFSKWYHKDYAWFYKLRV